MKEAAETAAAEMFADLRPRLIRLAYRMLGSVADAEDVVHDAWLRWLAADRDRMRRAFLRFFGQPPQSLRRSLRLIEGEPQETADNMS